MVCSLTIKVTLSNNKMYLINMHPHIKFTFEKVETINEDKEKCKQ